MIWARFFIGVAARWLRAETKLHWLANANSAFCDVLAASVSFVFSVI